MSSKGHRQPNDPVERASRWAPAARPAGEQDGQAAGRGRDQGDDAARSPMARGDTAIGCLVAGEGGSARLSISTAPDRWWCSAGCGRFALAEASPDSTDSPSARGNQPSSYSTSAGREELNSSTSTRLRPRQRGQCVIAARCGRIAMLRPHRGQFKCPERNPASGCINVLMDSPAFPGWPRRSPSLWLQPARFRRRRALLKSGAARNGRFGWPVSARLRSASVRGLRA